MRLLHGVSEVSSYERWELARVLGSAMVRGTYRPGPVRRIRIRKGHGTRPLEIASAGDRVVQRAILQAIQPLLDPTFDERSFGFRPGLGREHALIEAELLTTPGCVWVVDDLRDAFGQVPHARLIDVLRFHGMDDRLVELIERIITRGGRRRGIPTAPRSPDYGIPQKDQPWKSATARSSLREAA